MTKQEKIDQLVELLLSELPPDAAENDTIVGQLYQKAAALVARGITAENY